jgi:hypothetical protein
MDHQKPTSNFIKSLFKWMKQVRTATKISFSHFISLNDDELNMLIKNHLGPITKMPQTDKYASKINEPTRLSLTSSQKNSNELQSCRTTVNQPSNHHFSTITKFQKKSSHIIASHHANANPHISLLTQKTFIQTHTERAGKRRGKSKRERKEAKVWQD